VVDFALAVGQQQTVTVQGEVSQVETTSAAISTNTSEQQMREIPLNGVYHFTRPACPTRG
jgi:hypothetical protein